MMIVLIYSFTIKGTNFLNKHQLKYFCTLFVTFKGLKGNQIFSVKLYFYTIFHMMAIHKKTKHESCSNLKPKSALANENVHTS